MLRIHFMQQWFGLSDPAMEEALHDVPLYCQFARLDPGMSRLPDESTILRFRHLLEEHDLSLQIMAAINATLAKKGLMLKAGTVVDATLIAAPSSTKNKDGERDPEMHQAKKGNQWHFGMKAHIGVDADSGLVHSVIGTAANVNDVTRGHDLLHGKEKVVFADAGYQGADKRPEATGVKWQVAMRPSKRRALADSGWAALLEQAEKLKASVRAKVEHPFRVIKRQFGHVKVRSRSLGGRRRRSEMDENRGSLGSADEPRVGPWAWEAMLGETGFSAIAAGALSAAQAPRGLAKNTAQLVTLFALSNLWMVRKRILKDLQA
jgi:transposase, IS5 family